MAALSGPAHYDRLGHGYALRRRTDPRIAAVINHALGDARTVVNVGAGAGSYEPEDRHVTAIEPSATMRAQRPAALAPAIAAHAEALPLDDDSVDAAMAITTLHHWQDQRRGLQELRRVARGPVVVLTFDIEHFAGYWLTAEYGPELAEFERQRFPPTEVIAAWMGGAHVEPVTIGSDCRDGIIEAYFARPESYLDAEVRAAQSVWPLLEPGVEQRIVETLRADLTSGTWDQRHPGLREQREHEASLRLLTSKS